MKTKTFITLFTSLAVVLLLATGCSDKGFYGTYTYSEPICQGILSSYYLEPPPSESYDFLVEKNRGTTYTVKRDSLTIEHKTENSNDTRKIVKSNLTYTKKPFNYEYLYGDFNTYRDEAVEKLLEKYDKKYIVLITEAGGAQSEYVLLLLDDDVFIARMETRGSFLMTLDRIIRSD